MGGNSSNNPAMPPTIQNYVEDLTAKPGDKSNSSMEDLHSFSFTLTLEEVTTIQEREYLDFCIIVRHHQRSLFGLGDVTASPSGMDKSDMSVTDWARVFLAFQAEKLTGTLVR